MLTPADFFPYQRRMGEHMMQHPYAMCWAFMGAGKSAVALTVAAEMLDRFAVRGVLVVAPLRVCQVVWRQEARKWSHLGHLRFSLVHGNARDRETALRRRAQIYLINYEGLVWLVTKIKQFWGRGKGVAPPFDMLILDEITKVKNSYSLRSKAVQSILPYFERRVGLTGEPAPAGYADLFGQYLCVDGGERLGRNVTAYRETFLRPVGYGGYSFEVTKTGRDRIHKRIGDITLELTEGDYLDLPEVTYNTIHVDLPPRARKIYDDLEKELWVQLDSGDELEVENQASLVNKLLQCGSGAAYLVVGGPWSEIHKAKMDALEDALEEANGSPILLGYTYRHEAERIGKKFKGARFLSSKLAEHEVHSTLRDWSSGTVPLMCAHPASAGHGLTLTGGEVKCSTVLWFSLPWSLELYKQLNARIIGGHRREAASVVHHIIARDTVDELVFDTLGMRHATQEGLKHAVKRYRERRGL